MSHADSHDHHDHHHELAPFWRRIFTTSNHKDIGTMYLLFAFLMLLTGGSAAMVIRAELMYPGLQLVQPDFFNQMTTVHGLIMVFGAIMPAFTGFANWMVPMMIGCSDLALPRVNCCGSSEAPSGMTLPSVNLSGAGQTTLAGPIVVQRTVPVLDDDTADSLAARILIEEHKAYPEAVATILAGGWRVEGRRFLRSTTDAGV